MEIHYLLVAKLPYFPTLLHVRRFNFHNFKKDMRYILLSCVHKCLKVFECCNLQNDIFIAVVVQRLPSKTTIFLF